jgi:hypothetical protein
MTARYSIFFQGSGDAPPACRPLPERLPPFPGVAGGQHELHDLAADGRDPKYFASEKPSLRPCPVVCLDSLDFFE